MSQIGRKSRYVLRWLGILARGFAVVAAVLAALPFLVSAESVRTSLARSLSAWSGGPVVISGPIRIASVADLSVEASGVDLQSTPGLEPLTRSEAQSVTAYIRISSLFRGRLEFRKFVVASPRMVFRRGFAEPAPAFYGLGTARLALALSAWGPRPEIEFVKPTLFLASGGRKAYRPVKLERMRLGGSAKSAGAGDGTEVSRFNLLIASETFEARFRGECANACETARGTLRLNASADNSLLKIMLVSLAPWERSSTVAVSGDLNWVRGRVALDNAAISFDGHSANGSLILDVAGGRALLEGNLAYDILDVTPAWEDRRSGEAAAERSLAALPLVGGGEERLLDFDMRISAERFRAGSFETGPLAVALTATRDRVSIDVASMALFGGNATGRLDVSPSEPSSLSLRGSVSQMDPQAVASAFGRPFGVAGPAAVRAALTMPLTVGPPGEDLIAATGTFTVLFPAGGSIEGDVAETLSAALAHQDRGWVLRGGAFPFSAATIEGTVKPGAVDLKVQGESGDKGIGGWLKIAFPGAAVSGTVFANESPASAEASAFRAAPAEPEHSTQLVLSGTADAPILSSSGKPSLSN
jgi:AsmA protein